MFDRDWILSKLDFIKAAIVVAALSISTWMALEESTGPKIIFIHEYEAPKPQFERLPGPILITE